MYIETSIILNLLMKKCSLVILNIFSCYIRKPKKRRVKVHALDLLTEHNLKSKFILSPPGIGEDCYRHWESLLMGSCVVTLALSIRRVFSLLPVLFVQRWEDITPALLEEKYT